MFSPYRRQVLAAKGDHFVTRLFSEPKLFVKANEEELAELAGDRPIRAPAYSTSSELEKRLGSFAPGGS